MSPKQKLDAAIKAARTIHEKAQSEGRDLTSEEQAAFDGHLKDAGELKAQIERGEKAASIMAELESMQVSPTDTDPSDGRGAKSLGEHFVKSVGAAGLSRVKTITGATVAAPEFAPKVKAAEDTHGTPGTLAPWLTTYDRTVVRAFRRPVVSDLLGQGTLGGNSNAVTYLVEGAVEGDFTTVAPGGQKPQFHIGDPEQRTDALKKIAGFIKFTDEMVEDADFWVSEINERGLYLLALAEENQLLNGDGSGANVHGLRLRSGIQTEEAAAAADNPDALYRALAKVQTATGLTADGIVINPADYQALRLNKDGNGQYFGGGYFQNEYGNGGIEWQPSLWGVRTVVSAAVPAGRPLVGAFGTAATVYRKGGVRVESTNSHATDFTQNLITTRIEERVALAVRIPGAFVDVTLAAAA